MSLRLVVDKGVVLEQKAHVGTQLSSLRMQRNYFNEFYVACIEENPTSLQTKISGAICWLIMALEWIQKNDIREARECLDVAAKRLD